MKLSLISIIFSSFLSYGVAATGTVKPDELITNSTASNQDHKNRALKAYADELKSNEGLDDVAEARSISIQVALLKDSSGLEYVGGYVDKAELETYLLQLKRILADDFVQYRENQAARDLRSFHVTLLSPNEYLHLKHKNINFGKLLSLDLLGLGKVKKDEKATYFVVAQSMESQFYRQQLGLQSKDFHVTLGFSPTDIYGVRKGIDTLIKE